MRDTPSFTAVLIAVCGLVVGPTAQGKGPRVALSHSAYKLALEGQSRHLSATELELLRDDILARYTFLKIQVERAMRGDDIQKLGAASDDRMAGVPLMVATERLLSLVSGQSASPADLAAFARENGVPGCCAVYIALRGNLPTELKHAFTDLEFEVKQNSIGKYFELVRREPPDPDEKLSFHIKEFSWAAASGAVSLRVGEVGGVVVDELAERMQALVNHALETEEDLDTVVLGVTVLGALRDRRLADFPIGHLLESPRFAGFSPSRKDAYRKYYDAALARSPGQCDLRMTKPFKFLEWSQSLPRGVQFTQSD